VVSFAITLCPQGQKGLFKQPLSGYDVNGENHLKNTFVSMFDYFYGKHFKYGEEKHFLNSASSSHYVPQPYILQYF
jgi:hypothetical protein